MTMMASQEQEAGLKPLRGHGEGRGRTDAETSSYADEGFNLDLDSPVSSSTQKSSVLENIGWFRDRSVRGKVHVIFGTFFSIGFAVLLVLALGFGELRVRANTAMKVQDALLTSSELRGVTGELRYNSMRYLLEREASIATRQRESYASAKQKLSAIEATVSEKMPALMPSVVALKTDFDEYNATFTSLIDMQSREGRSEAATALAYELSSRGDALYRATDAFKNDLSIFGEEMRAVGVTYFFIMVSVIAVLALIATAILVVGLRYLSYDFSHKIVEITGGMSRLARGDRNFVIEGQERKDEIGEMIRALGKFKRASRQLEVWARERAERAEETVRLQEDRERERAEAEQRKAQLLDEVAREFERTVGEVVHSVASASSQLGTTASSMASTASQASERTSQLSQDMQDANVGATAAAAASDEFALSISEISRQAASSSQLARLANDATEEADTTISALSSSAEQVGHIVDLIQTIAQRTNLLALNASIEAARGGEAGRGFAVVASEVKELAMQTSRATQQVAEQISAMQDTTGASVSALRAIAAQVDELETTAVSIATAVDQQSVAGQDLARNIDLAARGTDKVAEHIQEVRELSRSTGAAANQVLSSANELESQASTLSEQVKTFLRRIREA